MGLIYSCDYFTMFYCNYEHSRDTKLFSLPVNGAVSQCLLVYRWPSGFAELIARNRTTGIMYIQYLQSLRQEYFHIVPIFISIKDQSNC